MRFLERKLKKSLQMKTRILQVPKATQEKWVPGSQAYPRYNLVARWDVGAKKTLHFTGHYDVVPPTAGWKTDPFKPVVKGNKIIGRGSGDMKASNTAALFAVQALKAKGFTPPWNIELSFTADEETGGYAGLGHLVKTKAIRPNAGVLLEGGGGDIIGYAHRGVLWIHITVLGKPGHGSNPRGGINALEKACFLIAELKKLERVYAGRRSKLLGNKIGRRPTLMIGGLASGGAKENTIPDRFTFSIDRRLLPEENLATVKAEILAVIEAAKRKDKELQVKVTYPLHVEPGQTDPKEHICTVARAAHRAIMGRSSKFRMSQGFNDMHWLTNNGKVPTIGYGVTGGGAHSDFEYAHISSLVETAKIYAEIALRI